MLALRRLGTLVLLVGGMVVAGCGGGLPVARQGDIKSTDITARAAFRAAAQVGKAWRPDARLVLASATWQNPSPTRLRTGRGAWAFYFASPGATGTAAGQPALVVTVAEGRAEAGPEMLLGSELEEVVFIDWKVDSDQALEAFLRAGGEDFLKAHPKASVTIRLLKPADRSAPEWRLTALDPRNGQSIQVRVDAASGVLVPPAGGGWSGGGR